MPQYFFDVEGERAMNEQISANLPDLQTAELFAEGFADTIMGRRDGRVKPWRVAIKNEKGQTLQIVAPE